VYLGTADQPVDSQPPRILATDVPATAQAGALAVARFAVADRTVTDGGPQLARAWASVDGAYVDGWFMGGDLFRVVLPTDQAGDHTVVLCAEDRLGNVACSAPTTYAVEGAVEPGTTGDTGAPPTETTETDPPTTDPDPGDPDPDPAPPEEDKGCGCASGGTTGGGWLPIALAVWLRARGGRRAAPRAEERQR
jgi:hypothetical protein